ncbi:MAG: type IV secretion system DNA-binding domain-containing protein [Pseudomonadota bacterium]
MTTLFRGGLSDWIRGSQSVLHEWRMLFQSLVQTLAAGFVILCFAVVAGGWLKLEPQERHTMFVYSHAVFNKMVLSDPTRNVTYTDAEGQKWIIESARFLDSQLVEDATKNLLIGAAQGFKYGLAMFLVIVIFLGAYFYFTGRNQSKEAYIRGARLGSAGELNRATRRFGKRGVFKLGGVHLPADFEPQHSLFIGASGTGKTQSIMRLLEGVRAAGQRAIVYDVNGAYAEKFYRSGKDVILNPLDARSPSWRVWNEVRSEEDYTKLAGSLIPDEPVPDTFWPNAAKALFAAAVKKLHETATKDKRSPLNKELVHLIMESTNAEFTAFMKESKVAPIADENSTRMGLSVRQTLSNELVGFSVLSDFGSQFSIRSFIEDEDHDSWLFITSKNDQLEQLRPLISLWVDTAVATVLSLSENPGRRLWLVFDELTSLQRLPALQGMMAQARKFGGCVALGFQSFAQLCEVYRKEGAEAVTGNCSTWAIMRANDRMTAEWASQALGKTEQQEANEGMSVGQHEMRDGRTLQQQRVERQLVLPSEIRGLDNLEMFLAPGRGLPVVRQKIAYRKFDETADTFVERVRFDEDRARLFKPVEGGDRAGFGAIFPDGAAIPCKCGDGAHTQCPHDGAKEDCPHRNAASPAVEHPEDAFDRENAQKPGVTPEDRSDVEAAWRYHKEQQAKAKAAREEDPAQKAAE